MLQFETKSLLMLHKLNISNHFAVVVQRKSSRKIKNIDEIKKYLEHINLSYVVVSLEDYSFEEQVMH